MWILGVVVMSPALVLTIPLGIAWAILVRHLPKGWFARRSVDVVLTDDPQ